MSKHIDPVCGKRLNINKSHIVILYKGKDYFLCCPQCQKEFEQNPQKYIQRIEKSKRGQ